MFFEILGIVGAIFTTSSFIPQAVKVIKTKDTSGISFSMYLMFVIGLLLWIIYGIYLKDITIIIANSVTLILAFIILKYKFSDMTKK